jgi:cephalosporin-C deacetylase-like acetyl esterase
MHRIAIPCFQTRVFLALATALMFPAIAKAQVSWKMNELSATPKVYPADSFKEAGVRSLFFEGLPWKGKPTRVFAWYGVPPHADNEKLPAMVLVHGGAGTAFADWVRIWTARGYAAIAIDTCGSVPTREGERGWKHHDLGGPPCWQLNQINWPTEDQWTYHAVADAILANSLLRSFPEVDASRIGLTGISWGGYLTDIIASVDTRFKFGAPVYGCGFLGEDSYWLPELAKMKPEDAHKWLALWDPSVYLSRVKMPMLWVDGTNDQFYPMDSLRKSYLLPKGPRTLSTHVRMEHGYEQGEPPEEIHAFADYYLKSGPSLTNIGAVKRKGNDVRVKYKSDTPMTKAVLNYTLDSTQWNKRLWSEAPAELNAAKHTVKATLPAGVTAFYIDVIDQRNLIVSSVLQGNN